MEDIRETGTKGLQYTGDEYLNNNSTDDLSLLQQLRQMSKAGVVESSHIVSPSAEEFIGEDLLKSGYGKSVYDEDVQLSSLTRDLNDFRANRQSGWGQLGNGALKMLTTAGTTFVDNTLGTVAGIVKGVMNLADDDPETGFWRGIWDNAVTNAMANISDEMEKALPNYMSEYEKNASILQRMGTANFWGDTILKNAGFTLGAAASIALTGNVSSGLGSLKGVQTATNALGLTRVAETGLTQATKAGKVVSGITKTALSVNGEASLEALRGVKDNQRLIDYNVEQRTKELYQPILEQYKQDIALWGIEDANIRYNAALEKLNSDIELYKAEEQKRLTDSGNAVYALNAAVLAVSNALSLGSLIRGGYDTSTSILKQAIKTSGGKELTSVKEVGKALLDGSLQLSVPEVKHVGAKVAGRTLLQATQEGLIEEGSQGLISTAAQIKTQAELNKFASTNTMLGNMINPDAEEKLVSITDAMYKAFEENYGAANSQGWSEILAGFITGAVGIPFLKRNSGGKIRPSWQGGIKEAFEAVTGETKAAQEKIESINKFLSTEKFGDRVKHAITQLAVKDAQNNALQKKDIQNFKNLEVQQLLSDAVFFYENGLLDNYKGMFEAFESLGDQDIVELKAALKQGGAETTALDKLTDDDIKRIYRDKSKSSLAKIEKALDDYKYYMDKYGDFFSDKTRKEAIMEMTYLNTINWDLNRRASELNDQISKLETLQHRTPAEQHQMEELKQEVSKIQKQATEVQKTVNEYINSPSKIEQKVQKQQTERLKIQLYKEANMALQKYSEAKTFKDIIDIYSHSPQDTREEVLNTAISKSEGEVKEKLIQFKNYLSDVDAISSIIESKFISEENANPQQAVIIANIAGELVQEMLTDESPVLSRDSIKEKFTQKLNELQASLDERLQDSVGITVDKEGVVTFDESARVNPEDFEETILDTKTKETVRVPKKGSEAERQINSATEASFLADLVKNIQDVVDNLDKLDSFRKAGNKDNIKPRAKQVVKTEGGTFKRGETQRFDTEGPATETTEPSNEEPEEASTDLLSEKDKELVNIEVVKGKSGTTYYKIVPKSGIKADKKSAVFKRAETVKNRVEELLINASDKDIKNLLETVSKTPIGGKTIQLIEQLLEKVHYKKNAPEGPNPPSNNEGQNAPSAEVSLNGNQHPKYVKSELSNSGTAVEVTYQKSGDKPVQVWIKEQGYNIQYIIDHYLQKIIEKDKSKPIKDRTSIHYLHTTEQPNVVFLGVEYNNEINKLIPNNVVGKTVTIEDKTYILVGTLGYERDKEGTEEQYNNLLTGLQQIIHIDNWAVDTEHINKIKDNTGGAIVNHFEGETAQPLTELSTLLNNSSKNPYGLTIESLKWLIVEGEQDAPTKKFINTDERDSLYSPLESKYPGQVYMYIPSSNGAYIPIIVQSIFLNDLEGDNNPIINAIKDQIKVLVSKETSLKDKVAAKLALTDYLVFSDVNNIYVNDETSKLFPNSLVIKKNGVPNQIIDFSSDSTITEDELYNIIVKLQPRININSAQLERNPDFYLKSGALRVATGYLGTVNSSFFVYPVNSSKNYVEIASSEPRPFTGTRNIIRQVNIQGQVYFFNGSTFTKTNGEVVEDKDGILKAALDIKDGKITPIQLTKRGPRYYQVGDSMYIDNGHGGLNFVSEEVKQRVLKAAKNNTKIAERKKKVKEVGKEASTKGTSAIAKKYISYDDIIKTLGNEDSLYETIVNLLSPFKDNQVSEEAQASIQAALTLFNSQPTNQKYKNIVNKYFSNTPITKKPETAQQGTGKANNFVNGKGIKDLKSAKDLENQKNINTFIAVLKLRENSVKTRELVKESNRAFGVTISTPTQLIDILVENKVDISSNDLDTVLEIVKNCR